MFFPTNRLSKKKKIKQQKFFKDFIKSDTCNIYLSLSQVIYEAIFHMINIIKMETKRSYISN